MSSSGTPATLERKKGVHGINPLDDGAEKGVGKWCTCKKGNREESLLGASPFRSLLLFFRGRVDIFRGKMLLFPGIEIALAEYRKYHRTWREQKIIVVENGKKLARSLDRPLSRRGKRSLRDKNVSTPIPKEPAAKKRGSIHPPSRRSI